MQISGSDSLSAAARRFPRLQLHTHTHTHTYTYTHTHTYVPLQASTLIVGRRYCICHNIHVGPCMDAIYVAVSSTAAAAAATAATAAVSIVV